MKNSKENNKMMYTVQKGYDDNGNQIAPGEKVSLACRNCALWDAETPALETKLCYPGRDLGDGRTMQPHQWSCEEFFISREMQETLAEYLEMDVHEVQFIRKLAKIHETRLKYQEKIKKMEQSAEEWFTRYQETNKVDLDLGALRKKGEDLLSQFGTTEHFRYALPFFYAYAVSAGKHQRRKDAKAKRFEGGDWVTWIDRKTKKRLLGIVRTNAIGLIKIANADPEAQVSDYTFKYGEWKKYCKPEHFKKRVEAEDPTQK